MKRLSNLYNEIISIDNLTLADNKAQKGKLKKYGVVLHNKNREDNILKLHVMLKDKTYRTSEYDIFKVYGNARVYGNADTKSNNDYCCFQSFGSSNRTTTFFKEKDSKIKVSCGCFYGSIEEFEKQVKETHGEGKHAKEYLSIIEVVKVKFGI